MPTSLSHFSPVQVEKPADLVIGQIRKLISTSVLKPGDKLPSERELAQQMGLGRGHVREALKKLEFYGILSTHAQSGTFVAGLGVVALEGLITHVLQLNQADLTGLLETRAVLEVFAAGKAAEYLTEDQLEELRGLLAAFSAKVSAGESGIEEDLLFHLKIAECARNPVLQSLISLLAPDMIQQTTARGVCEGKRPQDALAEHRAIFAALAARDVAAARAAMERHMSKIQDLFKTSS